MKAKKFTPAMRGLAALMTCLMVLSIVGTGVANTYRGALDDTLGTESYVTINDDSAARFKTDYATIEDMAAAARDIAIREGEEGTVVMKNDNGVLPLKANANVALFGLAAYNVYGPKGGNADAASLADALAGAGLNVNETLKDYYLTNIINMHTEMRANRWTGKEVPTTVYDHMYVSAPGDWTTYQIAEVRRRSSRRWAFRQTGRKLSPRTASASACLRAAPARAIPTSRVLRSTTRVKQPAKIR